MKRITQWSSGLALIALMVWAMPAQAQLNMQMGNGWSMSFSGNVNAFLHYESTDDAGTTPGGLVGAGSKGFNIRTGLLPAFAVFSIKGRDGGRDLGATFGFAPEIQCGGSSPNYTNRANCQGAQLDMRQVFMTVGGVGGGSLLMGRELSLFGRQN
ncbi:MAG: porin, partial [Gemmatimonadota bacterium]